MTDVKKKLNKKITNAIIFYGIEILYTAIVAIVLVLVTRQLSTTTVYQQEISSAILLGIIGITWLVGPLLNKWINLVLVNVYSIYLISQDIYNRAFNSYYRLNTALGLKSEVVGAKDSVVEFIKFSDFTFIIAFTLISILFIVLYFVYQRKLAKWTYRLLPRLLCIAAFIPAVNHIKTFDALLLEAKNSQDAFQIFQTDFYVYNSMPNVSLFVEKFGLVTLGYKDVIDVVVSQKDINNYKEEIDNFVTTKPDVINTNEFTGIFEGKNVLFVQAESFNEFALDETLTPTLWKLAHESIVVNGFDTPALSGSTSDTEFMTNASIIANSDGEPVCYQYANNTYDVTLANLFNEAGYYTLAVHNNYGDYYNRDIFFPQLGYQEFYDCTDLSLMDQAWDSEAMEVMKYLISDALDYNVMLYWVTFSGHQPYTLDSVGVSSEDVEIIKELYPDLEDKYVSYLAKNMDLDKAIKSLMDQCEYTETLDDLVIVFFGDHVAKGFELRDNGEFLEQTGKTYDGNFNNTNLYIYNSATPAYEYTKTATVLDILPTISNMMGFTYDQTHVLGRDIFDPSYDGFYFSNYGTYKTDNFEYDMVKDNYTLINENYSIDQAKEDMNKILEILNVSKYILKTDYFALEDNK